MARVGPFGITSEFPLLTFRVGALVEGDAWPGPGALTCHLPGLLS